MQSICYILCGDDLLLTWEKECNNVIGLGRKIHFHFLDDLADVFLHSVHVQNVDNVKRSLKTITN